MVMVVEQVFERAAGIDVSKADAKVCLRLPSKRKGYYSKQVSVYGSTTREIRRLCQDLQEAQVEIVVLEATGDYWKPFFYLLDEADLPVQLVNPKQAKNIPGRKSDVSDAQWLAVCAAHGRLNASFVPEGEFRMLRNMTRTRTSLVHERTREYSRMEKVLEDACIKLSVVVSELDTVTARRILELLVAGERDPEVLADAACGSLRKKTAQLIEALDGRFNADHGLLVGLHLRRIDQIDADIAVIDTRVEQLVQPFSAARDALATIPGFSPTVASAVLAEIGTDMSRFRTAGHLTSWVGTCPGQNESAGRIKSTKTRPGNRHLKGHLGIAAMTIARTKDTALAAKYQRICAKHGKSKALVAIERTLLIIIWNLLTKGVLYEDPGADYYARINPERTKRSLVRRLEDLGYEVTITPRIAA